MLTLMTRRTRCDATSLPRDKQAHRWASSKPGRLADIAQDREIRFTISLRRSCAKFAA